MSTTRKKTSYTREFKSPPTLNRIAKPVIYSSFHILLPFLTIWFNLTPEGNCCTVEQLYIDSKICLNELPSSFPSSWYK